MNEKIIKIQSLFSLIDYEPYALLISLVILTWLFYKIFLRNVSLERHKNIQNHLKGIFKHTFWFSVLFVIFKFLFQMPDLPHYLSRSLLYIGITAYFWGAIIFIKTSRLIVLQYLFLTSMRAGVPLLIVNIFSLILMLILSLWSVAYLFGVEVGPLITTSAAFSIVLGLALQDTLGNLFAGIAMQLDQTFEIDDWLEIQNGSQKIVGQVKEVSWRATSLAGWSDELITLPNRFVANSQLSNYKNGEISFIRSQSFKLPVYTNITLAKECILEATRQVEELNLEKPAVAYISESNDSFITLKVIYFLSSYGRQNLVGDQIIRNSLEFLKANGIEVLPQTYQIKNI